MRYIQSMILAVLLIMCQPSISQTPEIRDDSITLKLTVKTHEGIKLETVVNFENTFTHTIIHCKTNKEGKGECTLPVSNNYIVKIPGSDEHYEYRIPEFSISPLPLSFDFRLKE